MRALVVSDLPWRPISAGNRERLDTLIAYLAAQGIEIAAVLLPTADLGEWDVATMRATVAQLEIARPPLVARLTGGAGSRWQRQPPAAEPIKVDAWCPRWFRTHVARSARAWTPDLVIVEYVYLSACCEALAPRTGRRPLIILDAHDVMHQRAAMYGAAGMTPRWFHTTYAEEQRGLGRADVVLAITPEDSAVFQTMVPDRTVLTVPHGRAVTPAAPGDAMPTRLLYTASYNDLNVAGLRWFLSSVWPALRRDFPDLELLVCGNIATKLGPMPAGVVVRGFVSSLAEEYRHARVVIEPVQVGTGIKVKVVDALCHGRPVVTTRAGAAGLEIGARSGIVVVDDAAAFAQAVHQLFDDDAVWMQAVQGAVAQARQRFSPEVAFAPLARCLARRRA